MTSNVNKPNMREHGEVTPEYQAGSGGYLDRAGSTAREVLECKHVQRKVGNKTESVSDHAPSMEGVPGNGSSPRLTKVGTENANHQMHGKKGRKSNNPY